MNEINFISKNVTSEDKDLFFGPNVDKETFIIIEEHWSMANVLARAGVFASVSRARKQGEHKPIPEGFTILERGKNQNKKLIFIFKKS
jgi:hypothetical protein